MSTHKPFREIVKPNSNFEFVGNTKRWVTVSIILVLASIGMLFVNKEWRGEYLNWTIDFRGGTEVILAFYDSAEDPVYKPTSVGAAEIRKALKDSGYSGFAVAGFGWEVANPDGGNDISVEGMKVATLEFGAVPEAEQKKMSDELRSELGAENLLKVAWSGDRIFIRSKVKISWDQMNAFFSARQLELKAWSTEDREAFATPQEGTDEYNQEFSIRGIDAQIETLLESALAKDVRVIQTYGVGARAGAKLRNDGIKSLFYAMALIMMYLVFRFDVRYAPGAVVALLHDAILVVGVFAVTWQEVSLTTVAALLTVIGYSVNDSVVIFDRIRENVIRLKDKKFPRVINISLNETMGRTLLTSFTLFVVTLAMNVLGTGLVRNFAFAMNIGVIVGVYSSVFIASPVALAINNKWYQGRGERKSSRAESNS